MSGVDLTVTPPLYSAPPSETTGAAEAQKLPNCKSTEKIHSSNPGTLLGKEILQEIPLQNTLVLQRFYWYPSKGSCTWDPTGWTKWYIVSMSAINKPSHLCKHLPSRGRAYFQESFPIYKKHFPLHCPKSYNSAITRYSIVLASPPEDTDFNRVTHEFPNTVVWVYQIISFFAKVTRIISKYK